MTDVVSAGARATGKAGLLTKGVQALLKDESLSLKTELAMGARKIAEQCVRE